MLLPVGRCSAFVPLAESGIASAAATPPEGAGGDGPEARPMFLDCPVQNVLQGRPLELLSRPWCLLDPPWVVDQRTQPEVG